MRTGKEILEKIKRERYHEWKDSITEATKILSAVSEEMYESNIIEKTIYANDIKDKISEELFAKAIEETSVKQWLEYNSFYLIGNGSESHSWTLKVME